jgi:hypothetical protein
VQQARQLAQAVPLAAQRGAGGRLADVADRVECLAKLSEGDARPHAAQERPGHVFGDHAQEVRPQ